MKRARVCWIVLIAAVLFGGSLWAAGTDEPGATVTGQVKPVKMIIEQRNTGGWEAPDNDKVKAYIEEQSGVKFEIIHTKDSDERSRKVNLALASQEDLDVFELPDHTGAELWNLVDRGAVMAINDPLDKYAPILKKFFATDNSWRAVADKDGQLWGIPRRMGHSGNMFHIRKDWREKLGIKNAPTTLAELEAYLYAVRRGDPDGNGKADHYPIVARSFGDFQRVLPQIITGETTAFGANYIDSQNRVVPQYMHPKFKDYLAKMAQWHKDGVLHPEQYTMKKAAYEDLVIANKVGGGVGWYSDVIRAWDKLMVTVPEAYYEYPAIQHLNGEPYRSSRRPPAGPMSCIVAYSENAEWALKLHQWAIESRTNYMVTGEGIPGVHWEWVDESKGTFNQLKNPESPEYVYAWSFIEDSATFVRTAVNIDEGFVRNKYNEVKDLMASIGYVWAPDWYVAYKWKGTPVENTMAEAETLIEEAMVNIIIGKRPVSDWDVVIAQYRKMYGDKYVELATQMYREYQK